MRIVLKSLLGLAMVVLAVVPAGAHFLTDTQSREIQVIQLGGETRVLMRLPLTFVYARELAARSELQDILSAPFLVTELIGGMTYYQFDKAGFEAAPEAFADLVLRDFTFTSGDVRVEPELVGIVPRHFDPGAPLPTGLDGIRTSLARPALSGASYVSEVVVFAEFALPASLSHSELSIELSGPAFPMPADIHVSTRVVDHRFGSTFVYEDEGFWPDRFTLSASPLTSFSRFLVQGIEHILFGLDHVLFVLCLVLAAQGLKGLVWSVTGFTLGHSVTLAAGVLGFAPEAVWFIPAVELGVALSIAAMAALVVWGRHAAMRFWIAATLGLLHGFGFAALLAPMLANTGSVGVAAFCLQPRRRTGPAGNRHTCLCRAGGARGHLSASRQDGAPDGRSGCRRGCSFDVG